MTLDVDRWTTGWRARAVTWGAWTVFGLAHALQNYLLATAMAHGKTPAALPVVGYGLAFGWLWALLTPVLLRVVRHFRFEARHWLTTLLVHLLVATVVAHVDVAVDLYVADPLLPDPPLAWPFYYQFMYQVRQNYLTYFVLVAAVHAWDYYRLYNERRLRAAQLEAGLAEARLEALRSQLQPHFLFNALNAIAELVHVDPAAAERTLVRLSELLRLALEAEGRQRVPLRDELRFTDAYLAIEQERFRDRLRIERAVDDDALDALVPQLVLQPLVENALVHGIGPRAGAGLVRITARRDGDVLRVEVEDDGRGVPAQPVERVGLGNTRGRLAQLYGERARLVLEPRAGGGTVARLEMPFETAGPAR